MSAVERDLTPGGHRQGLAHGFHCVFVEVVDAAVETPWDLRSRGYRLR